MKRPIFIYDAFTKEKFGGNGAGILFHAEELSTAEKQNLAKELGFSETVFIQASEKADFKFEYFTPKQEVDLCGHATIAAIYSLFEENRISEDKDRITIDTKLGVLPIFLERQGKELLSVWMEQDEGDLSFTLDISEEEILASLGLTEKDRNRKFSLVKAYSGLWDLMIPLASKEALDKIQIDFSKVEALSEKLSVISFHPFFLEDKHVYVRNFAPIVDIPEESATGTSNGALAFYLFKQEYLSENEILYCHQGESLQRKSQILAKITREEKILVGGEAIRILKGEY